MIQRLSVVFAALTVVSCNNKASDRAAPTGGEAKGAKTAPAAGASSKDSERGGTDTAEPTADLATPPPADAPSRLATVDSAAGESGPGKGEAAKPMSRMRSEGLAKRAGGMAEDKSMVAPLPERRRPSPQSGQLTAGEWSDLEHWGFWTGLFAGQHQRSEEWNRYARAWGFDTRTRVPVRVVADDKPVIDARVSLKNSAGKTLWQARTDNRGNAELFAGLFDSTSEEGLTVVASVDGSNVIEQVGRSVAKRIEIRVGQAPAASNNLDLMFVVDTTGSMGDELSFLQSELRNVIQNIQDGDRQKLSLRTSVNFYRDTTDDYTLRPFGFTSSSAESLEQLAGQSASGGGDFPEAVDAALADAIAGHDWSQSARARLVFLVLDAPPHQTAKSLSKMKASIEAAAAAGVRIIPVASSGIDKSTEFLLRSIAVSTGGSYLFLTDDSGIGGSHLKPTIGPHEVKLLNRLLTEVIRRYTD